MGVDKYYIPNIEEFHVGFEYELLKKVSRYDNYWRFEIVKKVFTPVKTNRDFDWIRLKIDLEDKEIRVKYLDQEDIESLGFINSKLTNEIWLYKDKLDFRGLGEKYTIGINWRPGRNHLLVFYVPDEKQIPAGLTIFAGAIKNKSELKRLMKQLNIQ